MTSEELTELKMEIKEMSHLRRIFLFGTIPIFILSVIIFFYQNEDFVVFIISIIVISTYFGYISYYRPLLNLKKDIEMKTTKSVTTEVLKIYGKKNVIVKTKAKFRLTHFDLERFNVSSEDLKIKSQVYHKYAQNSRYIFELRIFSKINNV